MDPNAQKVITALRSGTPPPTFVELAKATEIKRPKLSILLSQLIEQGALTHEDLPWRKAMPSEKRGFYKGRVARGFSDIARDAKQISANAEKDSDRLGALRLLMDLRQMGNEATGPPAPNDIAGTIEATSRILMAAGSLITIAAVRAVWPGAVINLEATNGEAPQAGDSAGPPVGGDHLA